MTQVNMSMISWQITVAAAVCTLEISGAELADMEIEIWKTRTVPFPKDKKPINKWRHSSVHLFSLLGLLVRRVFVILATTDAPERLFSTASNVMSAGTWEVVKKMRLE